MKNFPAIKELKRQIKDRGEIQQLIANLFELGRVDRSRAILKEHEELGSAYSLIAGAAFSLWRAAFLTSTDENQDVLLDDCINYLGIVVRDNAIGFPQDRDARSWTVGFYLNSAVSRLGALSRMTSFQSDRTLSLYKTRSDTLVGWDKPGRMWQDIMHATRCALDCLDATVKAKESEHPLISESS